MGLNSRARNRYTRLRCNHHHSTTWRSDWPGILSLRRPDGRKDGNMSEESAKPGVSPRSGPGPEEVGPRSGPGPEEVGPRSGPGPEEVDPLSGPGPEADPQSGPGPETGGKPKKKG